MQVYTVHALRFGNNQRHGYIVGVYSSEEAAKKAAEVEEDFRSGTYACEILEWALDSGIEGQIIKNYIVIRQPECPSPHHI